jgi:alkylation response protein AidB-like acyl-CoA dehydrogenase
LAKDTATVALADRRIPQGGDWLSPQELAALTPEELVKRTKALRPMLATHSLEAEQLRRPVDSVWQKLRESGIFYHFVPKRYGGLEFGVDAFIDAMLPLAEGCSSTGWVASFCVEHNWMLAQFPEQAQDEIFGGDFPYVIAPGVTSPPGVLTPTEGGYRVTGRWKWGTGVMHADWILAAAVDPKDNPAAPRFVVAPAADVAVLDTWRMDGMIATGSNDIVMDDVFVPAHRVLDLALMRSGDSPGAQLHGSSIYRMPMTPFLALAAAIPALGTAKASIDLFRAQLEKRVILGTTHAQSEKPAAQMRLAEAHVLVAAAEQLLRSAARETAALGERRAGGDVNARIDLRAQIAFAVKLCRDAVRTVAEGAGAGAHALDNPLQRALRDIHVMASHVIYDLDTALELQGRAMIGLPPNSTLV